MAAARRVSRHGDVAIGHEESLPLCGIVEGSQIDGAILFLLCPREIEELMSVRQEHGEPVRIFAERGVHVCRRNGCSPFFGDAEHTAVVGANQNCARSIPRSTAAVADVAERHRFASIDRHALQRRASKESDVTTIWRPERLP